MTNSLPSPPAADATDVERMYWCAAVARLAPSKHNAQPWRFTVYDDGVVEQYADATRALASDRDDRELTIGNGAALYTFAVALRALGTTPLVELLPEGPDGPLARVTPGGPYDANDGDLALVEAIPRRHTNRGPLDASGIGPERVVDIALAKRAAGYRAFKLKIGFGAARDRANLAALRHRYGLAARVNLRREPRAAERIDRGDPRHRGGGRRNAVVIRSR